METIHDIKSILHQYKIEKAMSMQEFLKSIHLESKYFIVLVNGKRESLQYQLKESDSLTIIPKIAGG